MEEVTRPRRVWVVVEDRPFQLIIVLTSLALGVFYLVAEVVGFRSQPPESIVSSLPYTLVLAWYVLLFLGGFVGTVAMVVRAYDTSVLLERASMAFLAGGFTLYGSAILVVGGARGVVGACYVLALAVAGVMRIFGISRVVRELRDKYRAVASEREASDRDTPGGGT